MYLYPNLVAVRKKKCTQYELADEFGITQQEISRYERGETKAPINYIIDLAQFCGVSVDYILGLSRDTSDMLSEDDFSLLEIYERLTTENKIKLKERAETLLEMQTNA
ncbi:MAG: helix-turn-helix transcriptional regulator [Ruminococcus sp.]|nr:helix-turn-helix transcriptional regulator [Ruminococcus sp.]